MGAQKPITLRRDIYQGNPPLAPPSAKLLTRVQEQVGIAEDETTPDGLCTLQTVACTGACSLAPGMVINDRTYGRMTPEQAARYWRSCKPKLSVR